MGCIVKKETTDEALCFSELNEWCDFRRWLEKPGGHHGTSARSLATT